MCLLIPNVCPRICQRSKMKDGDFLTICGVSGLGSKVPGFGEFTQLRIQSLGFGLLGFES